MSAEREKPVDGRTPRPWEPPRLKAVGTVADVLKSGGGKVTVVTGDPGEPQKVAPTG